MKTTPWPTNNKRDAIFIPVDPKQFKEIETAKAFDKYCVENHNQHDRSFHLISVQQQHQREGKITLEVFTNIYGFQVRDTNNYGNQRMLYRGVSAVEALNFCKEWYLRDVENRGVIVGYVEPERKEEFEKALSELE